MKIRNLFGLTFSGTLLLLVAGSGFARGREPIKPSKTVGVNAHPAANAPWFKTEVDTLGDVGLYPSVAINPSSGYTYISHYDATNQALRMARYPDFSSSCDLNDEWGCDTLDSGADLGQYSSIAVNHKTEGVGIAYHDATNGNLKYLYSKNPYLWVYSKITIDRGISGVSTTGLHTSLKYNSNGQPFIAYHFNNPSGVDALMVAYESYASGNCVNGDKPDEWRCETIITGEGVGQYPSLVVKDDWEFHVAYYDAGNGDLWYGTSEGDGNCGFYGNDWACYPISGQTADVGKYASMYVDDAGLFHIAYYDATNDDLKYAVEVSSGGNCGVLGSAQCDTIDAMPADYHHLGISIAEDPAGYPMIAYQSLYGSLNVARPLAALGLPAGSGNCGPEKPFSTWYCETIDRYNPFLPYRNGDYISLAVSPSGLATIAYQGFITSAGGNLRVAYQRFQYFLPSVMGD